MPLKELFLLFAPFIKPAVHKLIEIAVKYAEKKFNKPKAGEDKKAFVIEQIQKYAEKNPEKVEDLKTYLGQKLDEAVDTAVEEAVQKYINK